MLPTKGCVSYLRIRLPFWRAQIELENDRNKREPSDIGFNLCHNKKTKKSLDIIDNYSIYSTRRSMSVHRVACGTCYTKTQGTDLGGIELQRSS